MENKNYFVSRFAWRGFLYGAGATILMTIVMLIGKQTGMSPMPEPVPVALTKLLFGALTNPALLIVAVILHLGYGGVNGGIVASIFGRKSNFWHGLSWGVILWLIMQLIVLPILGWGAFGAAVTPKIAMATFVLHLVYGAALGWGLSRKTGSTS